MDSTNGGAFLGVEIFGDVSVSHYLTRLFVDDVNLTEVATQGAIHFVDSVKVKVLKGHGHVEFVARLNGDGIGGSVDVVGRHSMFPFFWSGCSLFLCVFIIAHIKGNVNSQFAQSFSVFY